MHTTLSRKSHTHILFIEVKFFVQELVKIKLKPKTSTSVMPKTRKQLLKTQKQKQHQPHPFSSAPPFSQQHQQIQSRSFQKICKLVPSSAKGSKTNMKMVCECYENGRKVDCKKAKDNFFDSSSSVDDIDRFWAPFFHQSSFLPSSFFGPSQSQSQSSSLTSTRRSKTVNQKKKKK